MMKKTVLWLTVSVVLVCASVGQGAFRVCCEESNDLYRVMRDSGVACVRYATGAEAVAAAKAGEGVLVLAGGYPETQTAIEAGVYEAAAAKGVRLYVEYPSVVPGLELGEPKDFRTGPYGVRYDRTVVSSDAFGQKLPRLSITAIHDCRFVPVAVEKTHLVLARVVGFDKAVLGLPKDVFPILFEHPEGEVMVATTSLSNFVTGRYSPTEAWGKVWGMILSWLQGGRPVAKLTWAPMVRPSYGRAEALPADAQLQAVRRTADWYLNSRLLVHESWQPQRLPTGRKDPIPADWGVGDGSLGISEGFNARILPNGLQAVSRDVRNDCNNETAMLLSAAAVLFGNETYGRTAKNLHDYILFESILCNGPRGDQASPSYGIMGWAISVEDGKENMYYGHDNACALLGIMGSAALLKTDRWDEVLVRGILANFRTTGPQGFRADLLRESGISQNGWQYYWQAKKASFALANSPALLWATYLWLYDKTGYEPLLARAKAGIYRLMEAYPDEWGAFTNRMESTWAYNLLPLVWLVRVEDTPLHREWLDIVVKRLQEVQHASGAIPQYVDVPYASNEQYGSGESPTVYETGDPATDMLYTMNFALSWMHEAAAATGNPEYKQLEDRMVDFLVRIQTRCEKHAELDGCWYRTFDFGKWDYWGSDADLGWGVWSAETGWTQPWIAGTLALREMKTNLWDLTKSSKAGRHFEKYRKLMLPADVIEEGPGKADVPVVAGSEVATRPVIKKLGAVDINVMENSPFVFGGRLYRLESRHPDYYGIRASDCKTAVEYFGHERACIVDHETGEVVAEPETHGFILPTVFVDEGTLYVLATDYMLPSPPYGHKVRVWATKDLKTWEQWTAMELPAWMIANVSVCRKGKEYYMSLEVTGPADEVGVGYTTRFAKSTDMRNWEQMPAECTYGKDRSCSAHFLRYLDGYFYMFCLDWGNWEGGSGYVTNVVRSYDLVGWQASPFNPVLWPSAEDKHIANTRLSAEKQAYVKNGGRAGQKLINNSDIEFVEHKGKVIIGYACGAQSYDYKYIAEGVYDGTEAQFLRGWFPARAAGAN